MPSFSLGDHFEWHVPQTAKPLHFKLEGAKQQKNTKNF
jgi:hypothetical protein